MYLLLHNLHDCTFKLSYYVDANDNDKSIQTSEN